MISRVTHRSVVNIQEYTLCVFGIKKAAWSRGEQTRNAASSCLNAVYFLSLSLVQCVRFGAGSLKKEEISHFTDVCTRSPIEAGHKILS